MMREAFLIALIRFGNLPYIYGGDDPAVGLDCSGLVQQCLKLINLDPPGDQTADTLFRFFNNPGKGVPVVDCRLGDLLFFGGLTRITHCALGIDDEHMFEAAGGTKDMKTPELARAAGAKCKVSMIKRRKDLVAIIRPTGLPW